MQPLYIPYGNTSLPMLCDPSGPTLLDLPCQLVFSQDPQHSSPCLCGLGAIRPVCWLLLLPHPFGLHMIWLIRIGCLRFVFKLAFGYLGLELPSSPLAFSWLCLARFPFNLSTSTLSSSLPSTLPFMFGKSRC